jgi:hypothetical protein
MRHIVESKYNNQLNGVEWEINIQAEQLLSYAA